MSGFPSEKNTPTRPESDIIINRILRLDPAARQYDNSFATTPSAEVTSDPAVDVDALGSDVEGDEGASSGSAVAKRQKSLCPPFYLVSLVCFCFGVVFVCFCCGLVVVSFWAGV